MNSFFCVKMGVRNLIIGLAILLIAGCTYLKENKLVSEIVNIFFPPETLTFTVNAPAKYSDTIVIKSVKVKPFRILSSYGEKGAVQLKKFVETGIANEGFIDVVEYNPMAVVSGDIEVGKVEKKSYHTSYKTDDGTRYTYYYVKKLTITGNYSLANQRENRIIIGNSFNVNFEKEWSSGDNSSAAEAKALTDEQIVYSALKQAAEEIVFAVSPHKETVTRELEKGGDPNIKLGNKYLVNGRTEQAISIWEQVAEQTEKTENKAAAYYNMGVVREAQGNYKDAFDFFSKANELNIKKELYIKAMTRVEDAQQLREKTTLQLRR